MIFCPTALMVTGSSRNSVAATAGLDDEPTKDDAWSTDIEKLSLEDRGDRGDQQTSTNHKSVVRHLGRAYLIAKTRERITCDGGQSRLATDGEP
jgi:hypothetical protein